MSEQRPDRQPQRKTGGGRPPVTNGGLKFGRGLFGWILFIALAIMLFMLLSKTQTAYTPITLSDFYDGLKNDKVSEITIEGDRVLGKFREPQGLGEHGAQVKDFR